MCLMICTMPLIISIHALLAESDQLRVVSHRTARKFLSTLSLRRATPNIFRHCTTYLFLSTLSLRRATHFGLFFGGHAAFLSTLSLRRATRNITNGQSKKNISIHALLAESDLKTPCVKLSIDVFLSTLSLRRATVEKVPADVYYQAFLSTLSLRRAT